MKFKTVILALIISTCQNLASAQNKTPFDAYKAEADGYFIDFMETSIGIVATDNYASRIYLLHDGKCKVLFSAPGCGRYMTLSPDKNNIGFKYIQADGKQAPALLNIQTKAITLLHTPVDLCGQVSFTRDGKIAFTVGNELIVKRGNHSINFPLGHYVNIAPISPDGNFVCYNDDNDQLFLINLSDSKVSTLTSGGFVYPQWAPDASKLMYSSLSGEIYIYDLNSRQTTFISEGRYPSWTDDSQHIVFTKVESTNFRFKGSDIYKAKCDGSELKNLTNTPDNYEFAAAPSGNKIIYQSLKKKIVSTRSSTTERSLYVHHIYKAEKPLDMSVQGSNQKSVLTEVHVPGTVPYVNQVYDTPEWHYGNGSCAPTTAIMAIAYYNKVPQWPITTSNGIGNHTSVYGAYVADKYRLDEYYFNVVSATSQGDDAWGGYGYMWGNGSPNSYMASYIQKHFLTSVHSTSTTFQNVVDEINNGYPFPICNTLSTAGHLTLAIGYVSGYHTLIFNDPYGNKNNTSWPNWYGQNAHYDWPGYNNGNQNLNTMEWTVTAEGSEVTYNDTIIDDVFYNHGFYMNNSQNNSIQRYYHDLNAGYNNHYWYTITGSSNTDTCFVTWTPNLATAGNYEIFAYIPGGAGCNATSAKYQVNYLNGVNNVVVNQSQYSGQWVSLGIYSMDVGQAGYVYLGDATGVAAQNIAFDAMKFRYTGPVDNVAPTTAIASVNTWESTDFTASFNDVDNSGGSGLDKSYYQVLYYNGTEWHANANNGFFADNFDSYNTNIWSVPASSGTWQVSAGNLMQSDTTISNSNIFASLNQNLSNRYIYQFYAMIDSASYSTNQHRLGFHFFSDNGAISNRGNSYFIYFRKETNTLEFFKVVNDVFTLSKTVNNVITTYGQWNDYKIIFDRTTGKIDVYRNGILLGTWTDSSVLTTQGNYISFRTGNCKASISEFKVYRSRSSSETITVGAAATNDIPYQNPDSATFAAKIKSIVNDVAGNLSGIAFQNINIDWTAPSCVTVNDGTGNDIDTVSSLNTLSANWTSSTDPNSGIARYWYAIGTTAGTTDVLNWSDNGINTTVTKSGLTLTQGTTYYFSVKAENGAGLTSICSSDGMVVDVNTGFNSNENIINISVQPNPFNSNATIYFSQNTEQKVRITLTDMLGKEIFLSNSTYAPGTHNLEINADGLHLSKGIYTLKLLSEKTSATVRLIKY